MATKTILINGLLEKKLDSPVDWSFGLFPFYGWYEFVQTIEHKEDTAITKVTLTLELKAYYWNGVSEYGNVFFKIKFNDLDVPVSPDYLWTGTSKKYVIDITDKYRKLAGAVPQVLSIGISSVPPGHHSHLITTAYLDIEYSGSEPVSVGSGSGKELTMEETMGIMVSFMMQFMFIMMFFSMMTAVMTSMAEAMTA